MCAANSGDDTTSLGFGPFHLLPSRRQLLGPDGPVKLGMRAFDLLLALTEEPGKICSKDALLDRLWPGESVDETNLRIHVGALRKALGDGRDGARYIVNVIGRGYSFVAAVTAEGATPPARTLSDEKAHSLPVALTALLGRESAIEIIERQLDQRRFVSIVGPGGIGKTALGIEIAHRRAAGLIGEVYFIELQPGRNVASTLASGLGLPMLTEDPTPGLIDIFSRSAALLVLDGCEPVIDGAAHLAETLLHRAPGLSILATSREPLRAEGEWVHRLASLALPPESGSLPAGQEADIRDAPAVRLFLDRARASFEAFRPEEKDLTAIAGLCRQLDGIPLAIELVAARIGHLGLAGIESALDDNLLLRTQGRRTAVARHQTLRATLDWSFEL